MASLVSVTIGGQTSGKLVISFCNGRRIDVWDVSHQFLRRPEDRRLGRDWDLGTFCDWKIRVSQLWECGNRHNLAECAQWHNALNVQLCAGTSVASTGGGPMNDDWCGIHQGW